MCLVGRLLSAAQRASKVPVIGLHVISQYSVQQMFSGILYYNICNTIQHVLVPHGIMFRDLYQSNISENWPSNTLQ
jgi:hypothetical protein